VKKSCSRSLLGLCGGRLPQDHGKGQAPCPDWSGHRWPVAPTRLLWAMHRCHQVPKSLGMPKGHPLLPEGARQKREAWRWSGRWRWSGDVEMGWGLGGDGLWT